MSKAVKLAISISDEDFQAIETIRKNRGITRSGVVTGAIRLLRESEDKERLVRSYEAGYRKYPEVVSEIKARETAALDVLSPEGWQ
jgi:hypothetical protein